MSTRTGSAKASIRSRSTSSFTIFPNHAPTSAKSDAAKPTPKFTWEELDQIQHDCTRQAGEFTVADYAERYRVTVHVAAYRLRTLVRAGMLTARVVVDGGKRCYAYRIVKKFPKRK